MICSKCGKQAYRTWSYIKDGVFHSTECSDCYPNGLFNSYSKLDKLRSRSLAPDGKTVITGREGQKLNDYKRRLQHNDKHSNRIP